MGNGTHSYIYTAHVHMDTPLEGLIIMGTPLEGLTIMDTPLEGLRVLQYIYCPWPVWNAHTSISNSIHTHLYSSYIIYYIAYIYILCGCTIYLHTDTALVCYVCMHNLINVSV